MGEEEANLYIPETLCQSLGVKAGETTLIKIGNKKARAIIKNDNLLGTNVVSLSPVLSKAFYLPVGLHLRVIKSGNGLRIGPLVGILTRVYSTQNHDFKIQDGFFRKLLCRLNKMNATGYIFTPADIDWNNKTINGHVISRDKAGKWMQRIFPFPDVCYNRCFLQNSGDLSFRQVVKRFSSSDVILFNPAIGNKWIIHRLLSKEAAIKPHLPETRILEGLKSLETMLHKYGSVYVKPVGGSKGQNITRVTRIKDGYWCRSTKEKKETYCRSIDEVQRKIKTNGGLRMMLVQQAIKCPTPKNHFDIRVLVQKNGRGEWGVSGMAVRIAGQGQVTTNLHTGGHSANLDTWLENCEFSNQKIQHINERLEFLALRVAQSLNNRSALLGELGLDFILDARGNIWFLEANPKPGRRAFAHLNNSGLKSILVSRPMEYACHLAGF